MGAEDTTELVQDYYGKTLKTTDDLKTTACCTSASVPGHIKPLLANVHDEVMAKYYGCGLIAPDALKGRRVLDLGSGAGRDAYVLAQLVGEQGEVVGVDMTDEQLDVARRHLDWHRKRFGYGKANVSFKKGYIEQLDKLDLEPGSFDVVVSNCVINLSPDKRAVLEGVWSLLKPGGEMYFSDVYADRRVPDAVRHDPVLYGECLGGALYWNDFLSLARAVGFRDPRLVEDHEIEITNCKLKAKTGPIRFYSATYRLFKLPDLDDACEDYGQAVIYKGGLEHVDHAFQLDQGHVIEPGRAFLVCGNSWRMLHDTRFAPYFEFIGDFSTHYGLFEGCGGKFPFGKAQETGVSGVGGACCV